MKYIITEIYNNNPESGEDLSLGEEAEGKDPKAACMAYLAEYDSDNMPPDALKVWTMPVPLQVFDVYRCVRARKGVLRPYPPTTVSP